MKVWVFTLGPSPSPTFYIQKNHFVCSAELNIIKIKSNLMKFWVFTLGPSPESSITTITRNVKVLPHYINTSLPSIIDSCSQDVM